MPTPIMGPASAPFATVEAYAKREMTARAITSNWYLKALDALWIQASRCGVDPVVAAAQCGHETGFGKFGRAVTPDHGNTAGIKVRSVPPGSADDDPDIHARFAIDPYGRPLVGALAHVHHLMLYAGVHVSLDTPDPRAVWIWPGTSNYGAAPTVEALSGKWAPATDYGTRVAALVRRLRGES